MKNEQKKILKVRNLSVDFPISGGIFQRTIGAVHAVKNVSFDLIEGETLGIVGNVVSEYIYRYDKGMYE